MKKDEQRVAQQQRRKTRKKHSKMQVENHRSSRKSQKMKLKKMCGL
jgi:hypothetical protein